jgi:hypothetical protein
LNNKKFIIIAFIALISIVAITVVIFPGNETPESIPNNGIAAMSSLKFRVMENYDSQTIEITFMVKNLNTVDKKMRGTIIMMNMALLLTVRSIKYGNYVMVSRLKSLMKSLNWLILIF